MKNLIFSLFSIALFFSCQTPEKADVIIMNAKVYTVNNQFEKAECFAIKDGKFVGVGTNEAIKQHFTAPKIIDAKNKTILPGLIDAHCHFYGLGLLQQQVDVSGTKSFDEVLQKIVAFQKEKNVNYITGRGWDQNDWEVKEYPTKEKLDQLFPDTPVAIKRIDGHAMLVNQKALDLAGITAQTKVTGGEIIKKNGKITGVLIDNAMKFINIPNPSRKVQIAALKEAQEICFKNGLTTVDDAGLDKSVINLIDSLQQTGDLKIRIYAMVSNTKNNLDYYLKKGIIKTDKLNVRSIKVYADGALGSRGAVLKKPYSDKHLHFGALVTSYNDIQKVAKRIADSDYQMNTHAIGDSANYIVLKTYQNVLKNKKDRRWRIEHAQIIDAPDFNYFKNRNIIPSIQPTHATSDMYWAAKRLGKKRMKGAYAYKKLLQTHGIVALGTDFPVEKVNPMLTFYAAIARKDVSGYPANGFQKKDALSREEALKGMTIWAAYANFEEKEKGSIEVGKVADFVILDQNILEIKESKIPKTKVTDTYLGGVKMN